MQTDTSFLRESVLYKFFNFKTKSDPLLLALADKSSTSAITLMKFNKKKRNTKISIPIAYHSLSRYQKADEIIQSMGFKNLASLKEKAKTKKKNFKQAREIHSDEDIVDAFDHASKMKLPSSGTLDTSEIKIVAEELMTEFINIEIFGVIPSIATESCRDMINASLMLYSSAVLDRILTSVLMQIIPQVAKEAHREVTDSEYIAIRDLIIREVMDEEIIAVN